MAFSAPTAFPCASGVGLLMGRKGGCDCFLGEYTSFSTDFQNAAEVEKKDLDVSRIYGLVLTAGFFL